MRVTEVAMIMTAMVVIAIMVAIVVRVSAVSSQRLGLEVFFGWIRQVNFFALSIIHGSL